MCVWGGGGLQRGLGHNLLMHFYSLISSRMVVPLPSSRCLAEGNRIFRSLVGFSYLVDRFLELMPLQAQLLVKIFCESLSFLSAKMCAYMR